MSCGALDGGVYVERIAALRDLVSEMSEAHVAVLHRIFYLLSRLAKAHAHGNSPEQLADLWAGLLTPATVAGRKRSRASRVKDYRLAGLLVQHCACIFQGELDTLELPELPLPPHLEAEVTQERAKASQWQRIKGSLLRDSRGLFKIAIKEDGGGFYFDTIAQTDASDDRERLRPHDYLVSIGRKAVDEMTLPMVRGVIKEAGSMLEVEVRRYAPNEARGEARREQERRREREAQQLQRYQAQMQQYVQAPPPPQQQQQPGGPGDFANAAAARREPGSASASARQGVNDLVELDAAPAAHPAPAPAPSATADLSGLDLLSAPLPASAPAPAPTPMLDASLFGSRESGVAPSGCAKGGGGGLGS